MVSPIGIVPVVLYLSRRNQNVFAIFSALCVDAAIDIFDVGRITVRVVAATQRRIIGHPPGRVEFFVQRYVPGRMVAFSFALFM
jgi:hypothetical protein